MITIATIGTPKYINQCIKDNKESILVLVDKGYKSVIQKAAEAAGKSVNAYILQAITNQVNQDKIKKPPCM